MRAMLRCVRASSESRTGDRGRGTAAAAVSYGVLPVWGVPREQPGLACAPGTAGQRLVTASAGPGILALYATSRRGDSQNAP
jgi:hypothetical protein